MGKLICGDVCSLAGARSVSYGTALAEIKAFISYEFLFCKENNFFYKKEEDKMVMVFMPGSEGICPDSYIPVVIKIILDKIIFYFIEDDNEATFDCNCDEDSLMSMLDFFRISIDVQKGDIVGLKLDFE